MLFDSEVVESYGVVMFCYFKLEILKEVVEVVKGVKGFLEKFVINVSNYRCW